MKQVIIPFSLDEYNKGGYVVRTKGNEYSPSLNVRVLCTDKKGTDYPVVALVEYDDRNEVTRQYTVDGHNTSDSESYYDLVLYKAESAKEKYVFQPFEKILVRNANSEVWCCDMFSHFNTANKRFVCTGRIDYRECIPFNNETIGLPGTKNNAPEKYKNW